MNTPTTQMVHLFVFDAGNARIMEFTTSSETGGLQFSIDQPRGPLGDLGLGPQRDARILDLAAATWTCCTAARPAVVELAQTVCGIAP